MLDTIATGAHHLILFWISSHCHSLCFWNLF